MPVLLGLAQDHPRPPSNMQTDSLHSAFGRGWELAGTEGRTLNSWEALKTKHLTDRNISGFFVCVFLIGFYLFQREREGNINWLPPAPLSKKGPCALTGNRTDDLLVHGTMLSQLSHTGCLGFAASSPFSIHFTRCFSSLCTSTYSSLKYCSSPAITIFP